MDLLLDRNPLLLTSSQGVCIVLFNLFDFLLLLLYLLDHGFLYFVGGTLAEPK